MFYVRLYRSDKKGKIFIHNQIHKEDERAGYLDKQIDISQQDLEFTPTGRGAQASINKSMIESTFRDENVS